MAKQDKYRNNKASGFFDYTEGKLSDKERNAFERRMQKDPFDADAAEGFSKVSREEAAEDLHTAASITRRRIAGASSRSKRNRKIAWYSAAAAIASLMIVTTVFFRLNDNGLERFEMAPEMREAAKEQSAKKKSVPLEKTEVKQEEPVGEEAQEQSIPLQETEVEQGKSVGAEAMQQDEPAVEIVEDQEVQAEQEAQEDQEVQEERQVQENQIQERVASGESMDLDQPARKAVKEQDLQDGKVAMKYNEPVGDVAKEAVAKEDHAFSWEKMDKKGAAGRYKETQQRMAAPKAATEPKSTYDLQTPLAATDNVKSEQAVADISFRPTGTVSGVVRSVDDLEPLPGAVVRLKDSENGTVTDLEGRFTLEAMTDDEETLEVSYIGMKTEEVPATTEHPMEIALLPDEMSLDEVVVISYGTSKRSNIAATTDVKEADPSGSVEYESAVPKNGPANFRSYIDTTLVYPELIQTSKKEVVVLKFSIAPDGRPQNFQVIRAPDNKAFEIEAIKVVSEGPAWQPAKRNGQYIEEEVRLRIVFRKP